MCPCDLQKSTIIKSADGQPLQVENVSKRTVAEIRRRPIDAKFIACPICVAAWDLRQEVVVVFCTETRKWRPCPIQARFKGCLKMSRVIPHIESAKTCTRAAPCGIPKDNAFAGLTWIPAASPASLMGTACILHVDLKVNDMQLCFSFTVVARIRFLRSCGRN